jgi:anti-sigma B factor antagonist
MPKKTVSMRGNGSFSVGSEHPESSGSAAPSSSAGAGKPDQAESSLTFAISHSEPDARTSIVRVEGELDLASAPTLKWALTDVLGAGVTQIVVDLAPVTFIDSTALGVLVGVHRGLPGGARMAISGADGDVLNIFELTGLDSTFDMFPALDDALAWVRGSAAATG